MRDFGIGSWPARRAGRTPRRAAVVDRDGDLTYGALHERATRLAHALRGLGVGRGDRVAYLGPNHRSFLETLFASGALGAVAVPLNTRLAPRELEHCLSDSGAEVLVDNTPAPVDLGAASTTVTVAAATAGSHDYEHLLDGAATEPLDEPIALDDPCMIMYTSGTTGRPKGALLTHGNITWNALNVLVDTDLASDEVTLCVAPLFHTAALNMSCLPTLLKGGTVILESDFEPDRVLHLIEHHRVTRLFGVPVMFDAMARAAGWAAADLSSVRQLTCGGAPVPTATIAAYLERGLAFSQGYGLTEAAPGVLLLSGADSSHKAGSAGVPHFFTDVRVVDEHSRPVGTGRRGEVTVAGPNVMRGYWRRSEDTAAALDGGWLRTGDIATVDGEGYVTLVDRAKDMYISGGENIAPAEIEAVLAEHPAVVDCAVIAVSDATWGEVGRAFVVPAADEHVGGEELLAFARGRLAGYKVPKTVVFTDELPRSPSGKILKNELRKEHR